MPCPCCNSGSSQNQGANLVAVAAALSVWIGQGKSADELAVLASLFDLMRSNLALMALNTVGEDGQRCPDGQNGAAGGELRRILLDGEAFELG